jgi:predicted enzyme related to lactoylglutathione lyase
MTSAAGAVLYVEDHLSVASFYREVLGMTLIEADASHTRLRVDGFDLVLHAKHSNAVPKSAGATSRRRVEGVIRLIFAVEDVSACRAAALRHGGMVDAEAPAWAGANSRLRLGQDPEGNIFQVQPR